MISGGFVVGVTVANAGYGYTDPPAVKIEGGGGTGATAVATVFNGIVNGITILNPGSGYTSMPEVIIASPPFPPRAATATSTVLNGMVAGLTITDGGYGYTNAPAVIFSGGGGSGAKAVATIGTNGVVTSLNILNPGSGYASAPTVSFSTAAPVIITQQPASQTVNPGAKATFTVAATGTAPLNYQWKFNGSVIAGATSASLTLNSVAAANAGTYTVEVGNVVGTVASAGATLSVNTPATITQQPVSQVVNPGANVAFTVAATGTQPLTYQWKFNGVAIAGATSSSLTLNNVAAANAGIYTVEVGNVVGMITSAGATLSVNSPVAITQQPVSQLVNPGASVTFTVAAAGTPPLAYQWKFNGSPIFGATAASLMLNNVASAAAGIYTVDVSDIIGTTTSLGAALILIAPIAITQQPASQVVNPGASVTFTVAATGTPPLAYQWKFNGSAIAGANSASLTLNNVSSASAGTYTVEVSNAVGTVASAAAILSMVTPVAITRQPTSQVVNPGTNVTFTVVATGTPPLAYQWYKNGSAILAATNSSLEILSAASGDAGNYSVAVSNASGSVASEVAVLTVKAGPYFVINDQTTGGGLVMPEPFQSSYAPNAQVTLSVLSADGWVFLDWKGNPQGTNPVAPLQMTSDKTVRARFGTAVTARKSGGGTVNISPLSALYPYDTPVRLIAQPDPGQYFAGWSGSATGDANPLTLWVRDANAVIIGSFLPLPSGRVALTVIPDGYGEVSVLPEANTFAAGQSVTNLAIPGAGQEFLGWSGDASGTNNPLVMVMGQSKVMVAHFTKRPYLEIQPLDLDGILLSLAGEFTGSYEIQSSTNLMDWMPYAILNNTFGESQAIESPTAGQHRFYRATTNYSVVSLAGDLAFGDQFFGAAATRSLAIQNNGADKLTVRGISYPAGFSGDWNGGTIQGGGQQVVTITFLPTTVQAYGGAITISSDSALGINTIAVSGNGVPSGMIWIPPGTFTMGSPDTELDRDSTEGPQTVVTITKGFWMSKYETTQAEYLAVIGSNPSFFTTKDWNGNQISPDLNRPVEQVRWYDATNYCAKLTKRERLAGRLPAGYVYRLPTEAEWEYTCRAGTTTRFSYGDDLSYTSLEDYGWYKGNSGMQTHPVGKKLPNAWGLYDMHGNVWEWCQDWWIGSLPGGSVDNPRGPDAGSIHVYCGGSAFDGGRFCRAANRTSDNPIDRYANLGFRPVLAPTQ